MSGNYYGGMADEEAYATTETTGVCPGCGAQLDHYPSCPDGPDPAYAAGTGLQGRNGTPKLAGLAEFASLASEHYGRTISRKRAWELSKHPKFPLPIQELAMGPVWQESDVLAFLAIDRPAGRQRVNPEGKEG